MQLSYTFKLFFTLHNRTYTKNKIGSQNIEVTLTYNGEQSFQLGDLKDEALKIIQLFNDSTVIENSDPYLIQLIEPKSGNTVHDYLQKIRYEMKDKEIRLIGNTIPSDTRNSYKVLIFGPNRQATLEGIAQVFLDLTTEKVSEVTVVSDVYTIKLTD